MVGDGIIGNISKYFQQFWRVPRKIFFSVLSDGCEGTGGRETERKREREEKRRKNKTNFKELFDTIFRRNLKFYFLSLHFSLKLIK